MFFEMHLHTHFSSFDGFDQVINKVKYAKELGMKAIGISDHGNACGILQLYNACKQEGLKPLMGCEMYFQPKFDQEKPYYHLCLYAINTTGYRNLCRIISKANEKFFYYRPRATWALLKKYSEGIVCTSACVAGIISQAIYKGKPNKAMKLARMFKHIYGDNFYLEIQPIAVSEEGMQENINKALMKIGKELDIKCILTTDSHFTRPEDFNSYMMMHKMSKFGSKKGQGFTLEHVEETYKERYMHSEKEIVSKFKKMHPDKNIKPMLNAMDEIYEKIEFTPCDGGFEHELDFLDSIPEYEAYEDTFTILKRLCKRKLKETGRYTREYIDRAKYEMSVIRKHGFVDYFLIVKDYVDYAKEKGIYVGPGRGSVGGSLVAELLGITKIDPIVDGTFFDRFMRPDKKKMPDIDIDFEAEGQLDVIDYIINKYAGKASRIITFGFYVEKNLINDMCKVREIPDDENKKIKDTLSRIIPKLAHFEFDSLNHTEMLKNKKAREIDRKYPGFIEDFCKLFGQVKYYGQHPAGVIVTKGELGSWVPLMKIKGQLVCSYDRLDAEDAGLLKFDILGLKTLSIIKEIETKTDDFYVKEKTTRKMKSKMYKEFRNGNTEGIFQLNKKAAQDILIGIEADNFQDLIAAISLNRPGALQLKMHEKYAENKQNLSTNTPWYKYTKDAYGTIIYQEHIMQICSGLAGMDPAVIDKLMKFKFTEDERLDIEQLFVDGAMEKSGINEEDARMLFEAMSAYTFNKGHGAGYAEISEWQMYHKIRHPNEFWCATLKYEGDERRMNQYKSAAIDEGCIILLAHVNGPAEFDIVDFKGDRVMQEGLSSIKFVGLNAAKAIQKYGPYYDFPDFEDKWENEMDKSEKRSINKRTINALKDYGAFEFNDVVFMDRVVAYNSALKGRTSAW